MGMDLYPYYVACRAVLDIQMICRTDIPDFALTKAKQAMEMDMGFSILYGVLVSA